MKNLLFIVAFITFTFCGSAQKVYFIYLQSDNYSSFYVKMNDKIYSSATSGYLILSNLVDSTYKFSVGFPSSQNEARFVVPLNAKDKGFLIKQFDSGFGLFDLQNLTIINAQKDESVKGISYLRRNDEFSSLLSKAANDTSLLYAVVRVKEETTVQNDQQVPGEIKSIEGEANLQKSTVLTGTQTGIVAETKKQDTVAIVPVNTEAKKEGNALTMSGNDGLQKDTVALATTKEQSKEVSDTEATVRMDTTTTIGDTSQVVFKRSRVKKHSESSTTEGFGLVYYDINDEEKDTIRILIPNPPITLKQAVDGDSSDVPKEFIHVEDLKKDSVQQPVVVSVKNNAPEKSQCKAVASNNDFFKLRKNMAAKNTDEDMVAEARKFFKSKCFTTEQVKNLSALFLTSSGKYQFFDAVYLHVSDQENFSSLASEIKDDYYLKRFKALIGE